jgi:hypothetical protein
VRQQDLPLVKLEMEAALAKGQAAVLQVQSLGHPILSQMRVKIFVTNALLSILMILK